MILDPATALHHAELRLDDAGSWSVIDLGAVDGVPNNVWVDGTHTSGAQLPERCELVFGAAHYRFDAGHLSAVGSREPLALHATALTFRIPSGEVILDGVELSLARRQMLAVVGPTGSGKSTLLKTLTGFLPPSEGEVLIQGASLYRRFDDVRRGVGYVPQDDILHPQLTVKSALEFGALLRFGADATDEERSARVSEVMEELGLSHRGDTQIEKLSGGQRKRTSVALELLTRPEVLMLDEPTSGLDPGFEKAVMALLRELANAGRTVVVVTHSLQSLELCDKVLFLAPGGQTAYFGPPANALAYFGRSDYADVFQDLETQRRTDWKARFASHPEAPTIGEPSAAAIEAPSYRPPRPSLAWRAQVLVLSRRQLAILVADKRNLAYLAAEVFVPALLILALVSARALNSGGGGKDARTLIGALAISACVIGAANSIREIVKEVPIYLRERSIGLSRTAYLTSKVVVLGSLTAVQTAALVIIATARADGPTHSIIPGLALPELIGDMILAAIGAMALGLLCSALVSSSEKAMALIPVVFIVMWLFSGIALDLQSKPVMREVGYLTSANWGVAAAAASVDEWKLEGFCGRSASTSSSASSSAASERFAPAAPSAQSPGCDARWQADIAHWLMSIVMELVLFGLCLAGASEALARKEPVTGTDNVPTVVGRAISLWALGYERARSALTSSRPHDPPPAAGGGAAPGSPPPPAPSR